MSLNSILKSKIFTIVAILFVAWLGLSAIKIRTHTQELTNKKGDLSSKADKIEEDNQQLTAEIEHSNDPLFLEKEAKQKLNLKLADENVVFIYATHPPVGDPASSSNNESLDLNGLSNIKKWYYWLLGY